MQWGDFMKLKELDLLEFLPKYMQQDLTAQGIAYAVTIELKKIIDVIEKKCNIYGRIEELEENLLDELAWQFNIPEYISTLDVVIKRAIVKNCIKTHRERGTVAAVEKVVADVFGNGYVAEWFEYGGMPYHFRVYTSNVSATDDMVAEFEKIIKSTQNLRSVLDDVVIETSCEMNTYFGGFMHTADIINLS